MAEESKKYQESLSSSRLQSSVHGLKQFLVTSNQCDYVKKRIKILERIDNHKQAQVHQYKNSLEKFEKIKNEKELDEQMRSSFFRKKKILEEEQKQINKRIRDERRNKIYEVLKEIENERLLDRNKVRQQSQNIALNIQQNKEKDLREKREKRDRVLQYQNLSKQNYKNFFNQKKEDLARRTLEELDQFEQKKKQKVMELHKMSKIELDVLEKQSQTKNQYNTVRIKLAEIYGVENKGHKNTLSLHSKIGNTQSGQCIEKQAQCHTNNRNSNSLIENKQS